MENETEQQRGFFLSLEGGDGCGKSTQMKLLGKYLKRQKLAHVLTAEPGGTRLGAALARLLLDPSRGRMSAKAELFLYLADRAQHVAEVITPALCAGKAVVASRYIDATVAYQAYGRGLPLSAVMSANELAGGGLEPDLTVLLDIPPQQGLKRLKGKGDRLEREKLDFHQRVGEGYKMLAKAEPGRIKVVDAALPVAKVHAEIVELLEDKLETGNRRSEVGGRKLGL